MNKTIILTITLLTATACTHNPTKDLEDRAEALQERADALTELQDAEIDLAQAEGRPLTGALKRREAERQANKQWLQHAAGNFFTKGERDNVNIDNSSKNQN
jgi:hypothetical protein